MYNIPLLIVLSFLFITLIIGLYVSQKATTFREYAIGNKQFSTSTLVATVLATLFGGGSIMREVPKGYIFGILYIIFAFLIPISNYIISILALRMGPFMHHISMAETIGSIYGKNLRILTALLATGLCIGVVSIQINVMSCAVGMCMDTIDPYIIVLLSTLTLILYSVFGGIRSITITDLFQLATFTIFIPFLIKFLFVKTDKSFLEIVKFLKDQEKVQWKNLFLFDRKVLDYFLTGLGGMFYLLPSVIQRVYMSNGPIQAKKVFSHITIFSITISMCIFMIALFVFVGNPILEKEEIWNYILTDIPPAYKTYLAISILAMTMSTADSYLQTASIMISYDIVESIKNVKLVPYYQIRIAKLTILITGILSMILTVYYPDLFELSTYVFKSFLDYFHVIVTPIFILTIFGFRGTTCTASTGMIIGTLVMMVWNHWIKPKIEIDGSFICIVANCLATMGAHYLLPQSPCTGWMDPDPEQKRMMQLIRAFKKHRKNIDLE